MGAGVRRKHKTMEDTAREGMCPTHDPKFEWFPDHRIERGERQEQCAACWRWLWPDERGPGFVATGESDGD